MITKLNDLQHAINNANFRVPSIPSLTSINKIIPILELDHPIRVITRPPSPWLAITSYTPTHPNLQLIHSITVNCHKSFSTVTNTITSKCLSFVNIQNLDLRYLQPLCLKYEKLQNTLKYADMNEQYLNIMCVSSLHQVDKKCC